MDLSPPSRLPHALSVALLSLLLALNAVTTALQPAMPVVGETTVSKLTARAPLAAPLREPAAVAKAPLHRGGAPQDDGGTGTATLPPQLARIIAPLADRTLAGSVLSDFIPRAPSRAYHARAPPFAV